MRLDGGMVWLCLRLELFKVGLECVGWTACTLWREREEEWLNAL